MITVKQRRRTLVVTAAAGLAVAPDRFSAFVRNDALRWAKLVRYLGAKPE